MDWNWGEDEEYAPLLEWMWDNEGSEENPEGAEAAENPAAGAQKQVKSGKVKTDEETQAVINGEIKINV